MAAPVSNDTVNVSGDNGILILGIVSVLAEADTVVAEDSVVAFGPEPEEALIVLSHRNDSFDQAVSIIENLEMIDPLLCLHIKK